MRDGVAHVGEVPSIRLEGDGVLVECYSGERPMRYWTSRANARRFFEAGIRLLNTSETAEVVPFPMERAG